MLESVGVNVTTLCSRTRKTATTTINRNERSALVKDLGDLGSVSPDDWLSGAMEGTHRQQARLINASCNAFFLRRGLDPSLDGNPLLHRLVTKRCREGLSRIDVPVWTNA